MFYEKKRQPSSPIRKQPYRPIRRGDMAPNFQEKCWTRTTHGVTVEALPVQGTKKKRKEMPARRAKARDCPLKTKRAEKKYEASCCNQCKSMVEWLGLPEMMAFQGPRGRAQTHASLMRHRPYDRSHIPACSTRHMPIVCELHDTKTNAHSFQATDTKQLLIAALRSTRTYGTYNVKLRAKISYGVCVKNECGHYVRRGYVRTQVAAVPDTEVRVVNKINRKPARL